MFSRPAAAERCRVKGQTIIDKLEQFTIAARSLFNAEDTVAALSAPAITD
jgi:hypothetical protein